MSSCIFAFVIYFAFIFNIISCISPGSPWHYVCVDNVCKKQKISGETRTPKTLEICQLTCGEFGPLWPKPTGSVTLGTKLVIINPANMSVYGVEKESVVGNYVRQFLGVIQKRIATNVNRRSQQGAFSIRIRVNLKNKNYPKFYLDTDESYQIEVEQLEENTIRVNVTADSYFGARHALETMSQLIVFDAWIGEIRMLSEASIIDRPKYPYRGLMLDVANNFIDKSVINRTIMAMAMCKMNSLHLHLTDSQSFPYHSKSLPLMSYYGSFEMNQIYSPSDIKDIVELGSLFGVRVIPEFNTPAHIGEGWQWADKKVVSCFQENWNGDSNMPCGQLNPIESETFRIISGIYSDLIRDFNPIFFHMGADGVNITCWNSSLHIRQWMQQQLQFRGLTERDFRNLFGQFLSRSYDILMNKNNDAKMPVILWASDLVEPRNINPDKYVIQITSSSNDEQIASFLRQKYSVIFSNYDSLFLSYGVSSNSNPSQLNPNVNWKQIYNHSPREILKQSFIYSSDSILVLGSEAILWSTWVDSSAVDTKLWPRSAALAERLWSDPETSWLQAEPRFLMHHKRLTSAGILTDTETPRWCFQNPGRCHTNK